MMFRRRDGFHERAEFNAVLLPDLGGGNFASSMTNINAFFPQRLKGWALGINAGGGNLGVPAVQLVGRHVARVVMVARNATRLRGLHAKLAPALHRIELARSSPTTVSQAHPTTSGSGTTTTTPPSQGTTPTTAPQNLVPSAAPEPSMLLLAACMTGWAVVKVHRRGRHSGE